MTQRPDQHWKVIVSKGIVEQGLVTLAGGEAVCKLTVGYVNTCSSEVMPEALSDPLLYSGGWLIFLNCVCQY